MELAGVSAKRGGSKRVPDYQLPEKGALMKFYDVAWAQGVYGKALTYDFFRSV
jgi:hypothetical protein